MLENVIVWKILWSSNGYCGWDDEIYREYFLSGKAGRLGYGYFIDYGFGHEWWNFYESFSDEYYFGYAPPLHDRKPRRFRDGGLIFFISRSPELGNWYVVGIYGNCSINDKPFDVGMTLWDTVENEYRGHIREVTRRELLETTVFNKLSNLPSLFYLKAPKKYSTVMPTPIGINLQRDVGVKFLGQANYLYINLDRAERLLEKLIKKVSELKPFKNYWCNVDECLSKLEVLLGDYLNNLRSGLTLYEDAPKVSTIIKREEVERIVIPPKIKPERVVELPESLIEDKLAENLSIVEDGLKLLGRQVPIPIGGRIDILAKDRHGNSVIIEVKGARADDAVLTQLLDYISSYKEAKKDENVRGIIIAQSFTKRLIRASRAIKNIKLVEIEVDVNIRRRRVVE